MAQNPPGSDESIAVVVGRLPNTRSALLPQKFKAISLWEWLLPKWEDRFKCASAAAGGERFSPHRVLAHPCYQEIWDSAKGSMLVRGPASVEICRQTPGLAPPSKFSLSLSIYVFSFSLSPSPPSLPSSLPLSLSLSLCCWCSNLPLGAKDFLCPFSYVLLRLPRSTSHNILKHQAQRGNNRDGRQTPALSSTQATSTRPDTAETVPL